MSEELPEQRRSYRVKNMTFKYAGRSYYGVHGARPMPLDTVYRIRVRKQMFRIIFVFFPPRIRSASLLLNTQKLHFARVRPRHTVYAECFVHVLQHWSVVTVIHLLLSRASLNVRNRAKTRTRDRVFRTVCDSDDGPRRLCCTCTVGRCH